MRARYGAASHVAHKSAVRRGRRTGAENVHVSHSRPRVTFSSTCHILAAGASVHVVDLGKFLIPLLTSTFPDLDIVPFHDVADVPDDAVRTEVRARGRALVS